MLLIKTSIILAIIVVIYFQDLSLIFGKAIEFTEGNISNYVLTIPFLIAYIIYRKRHVLITAASLGDRRSKPFRIDDAMGITLCVAAMMIYIFGSETLYSLEYHIVSLTVFLAGSVLLVFNIATFKHAIFAILLTIYLQPPPGFLVSELAADLSWSAAVLVEAMLQSVGITISLDSRFGAPALLMTMADGSQIPFFVGEPSSGVFSTIGLSLFSIFVAYITRGKLWKRIAIFVMGFPIFFILNTLRIATILMLWYVSGEGVAESFHIISGSLMVTIGTIVLLITGEKLLKLSIRSTKFISKKCAACGISLANHESLCLFCGSLLRQHSHKINHAVGRVLVLVLIFIVVVSTSIISGPSYSDNSAKLSELDIEKIEGPETVSYFLPQIDGWDLKYAYRDSRIESVLNQDATLAFRYMSQTPPAKSLGDPSITPYIYSSVQISNGHHNWEDSLVTYPSRIGRPGASVLESSDHAISDEKLGRFLLFKRVGATTSEAVFYWFERVPLKFGSDFENRNVLISLWTNTDMLARSGLIIAPNDGEGIRALYLPIAKIIAEYWTNQSSQVFRNEITFLFIRNHIDYVMIIIFSPLGLLLVQHLVRTSRLKLANRKLCDRLTDEDRLLFSALANRKNRYIATTGEMVAKEYQRISQKQISEQEVMQRLQLARRSGLIRDELSSTNDEPLLVWKPMFDSKKLGLKGIPNKYENEIRRLFSLKKGAAD